MSTSSGSVPNAIFRGLRQACVWFPQVLGPHPQETNTGEEILCVCVCVCVCAHTCVRSLSYLFPTDVFSLLQFTVGRWRGKALQLGLQLCLFKIHIYDERKCGRGGRQTGRSLSIPQEFGTMQWLNWRWFWPQETSDNVWRYSGVVTGLRRGLSS